MTSFLTSTHTLLKIRGPELIRSSTVSFSSGPFPPPPAGCCFAIIAPTWFTPDNISPCKASRRTGRPAPSCYAKEMKCHIWNVLMLRGRFLEKYSGKCNCLVKKKPKKQNTTALKKKTNSQWVVVISGMSAELDDGLTQNFKSSATV